MNANGNGFWKSVPWTLIIFLAAQTVGAVWMGASITYQVSDHERLLRDISPVVATIPLIRDHQISNEARITVLETAARKLDVIDERQRAVIETLSQNSRKLDTVIENVRKNTPYQ